MKRYLLVLFVLAFVLVSTQAQAGEGAKENFEKMKSLAGEWQGKGPEGKSVLITYEVVSNGSTVMERMQTENEPIMITMYHLDGEHLMMTHYCSAMNQPRMRASSSSGSDKNFIRFSLMDVTNLAKPTDGHMQKLVITFTDEDHLDTQWTFVEDGKAKNAPFELERKKMSIK